MYVPRRVKPKPRTTVKRPWWPRHLPRPAFVDVLFAHYSTWGFCGSVIGIVTIFVSMALYSLDTPFSLLHQPPSDLGWGPNGSGFVYRGGLFLSTLLLVPFTLYLTRHLRRRVDAQHTGLRRTIGAALAAAVVSCVSVWSVVTFYDQNGDEFYIHDIAATLFIASQPVMSVGFAIAMSRARMPSVAPAVGAALVAASSVSVALMLIPLLRKYNIHALYTTLSGLDRETRQPEVGKLANIAWWFPISEFALIESTYLWYLLTAIASRRAMT